jgi:hypothetical protein
MANEITTDNIKINKWTVQEAQNIELGQSGYEILTVTGGSTATSSVSATTDRPDVMYYAFTALSDKCSIVAYRWKDDSTTTGVTSADPEYTLIAIPVGTTVYGNWKALAMVSSDSGDDSGILYKANLHRYPEGVGFQP